MNFFEQQRQARTESRTLWIFFVLAVIAIVVAVDLAVWTGYSIYASQAVVEQGYSSLPTRSSHGHHAADAWTVCGVATLLTLLTILLGSVFKTVALRSGGGAYVAQSMGGRRIEPDTTDLNEKRLVNVVEEMAIASGTNVPSIWGMDQELGINAFAAGYAPSEAAICVSRGCMVDLTRDELQGVVAHEFSHVFNGDMRANIRMLGVLHGILVIGLTGYWAVRLLDETRPRYRSKRSNGRLVLAIMVVGILLIAIGYIGVFFGRLIKASLSRTREYLADASAVQFTRNPLGIAGALAKIHHGSGSGLQATQREEFSHFYFADGVGVFLPFFETHPPLRSRLSRILPGWEQKLSKDKLRAAPAVPPPLPRTEGQPLRAMDAIGRTAGDQIALAQQLLAGLPSIVYKFASVPQGAKLLVVALLNVEHTTLPVRLAAYASDFPREALVDAHQRLRDLGESRWFPVANLCMPALQRLAPADRAAFTQLCNEVVLMDGVTTTFEASLLGIVQRSLAPSAEKRKPSHESLQHVRPQLFSLAAIMAAETSSDEQLRYQAFRKGLEQANLPGYLPERLPLVTAEALPQLLRHLAQASLEIKEATMLLLVEVMQADGQATAKEKEILRTVAASLECPLPLFAQSGFTRPVYTAKPA